MVVATVATFGALSVGSSVRGSSAAYAADAKRSETGVPQRARSSTAAAAAGERFVPWLVVANSRGKVWAPSAAWFDGAPVLLEDESIARVEERGWARDPDLTRGLSFDLVEGPNGAKTKGALRGHLTVIDGTGEGGAVAVVASTYAITVQDVYLGGGRGEGWRRWLHFWSGADRRFIAAALWRGHPLALVANDTGYGFEIAGNAITSSPVPRPGSDANLACRTEVRPSHLAVLPSGAVFVGGSRCGHDHTAVVEAWPTGEGVGVLRPLPSDAPLQINVLAAGTADEIYAGGCAGDEPRRPLVARLRGEKWDVLPAPAVKGCVQKASVGGSGDLWVITGQFELGHLANSRLWRRRDGGAWRPVDVASPWSVAIEVTDVRIFDNQGRDDVWLTVAPKSASKKPSVPDAYAVLRLTAAP